MFEVIKSVIDAGGYKLTALQDKIKRFYLRGDLTEAEMDELLVMAGEGATADGERPEMLTLIQRLSADVASLRERVDALEGKTKEDTEASEYPAWEPWDGISNNYQYGAVVSHNGHLWESTHNGHNVWEPGVYGWVMKD